MPPLHCINVFDQNDPVLINSLYFLNPLRLGERLVFFWKSLSSESSANQITRSYTFINNALKEEIGATYTVLQ